MTCPAHNPKLSMSVCWEYIWRITDSREIARCRACPHGRALMATVAGGAPETAPQPDAENEMPTPVEGTVEKRTYTAPELAALIGVDNQAIFNARSSKVVDSVPGSKLHTVREYMRENGITWEQVVPARKPRKNRDAATSDTAPKAPGINQEFEDAITKMEAEEADRAAQRTPAAEPHPVGKFLDAVAEDLTAMEPEEDPEGEDEPGSPTPVSLVAFPPLRPDYATDVPRLAHIPLEALIAELTRRLPRASVIIQ